MIEEQRKNVENMINAQKVFLMLKGFIPSEKIDKLIH